MTILALDHLSSNGDIVTSGRLLAIAVNNAQNVVVSFAGLRGASTNYFNEFLRSLRTDLSVQAVFDSDAQRATYDACLQGLR